jgi:glycosyltransferase involved in cell wall biosynthesis
MHPIALLHHVRGRARVRWGQLTRADRRLDWHVVHPAVQLKFVPSLDPKHVPVGDAVVATAWETAEYASVLPADRGVGHYLIQHHETWSGPAERVDATWRLPLYKVVIARWLLERAAAQGLTDVVHIPNAIDLERFRVTRPVDARPPRVAMLLSSWHTWKGAAVGIRALELAKREVPELQAVTFGLEPRSADLPAWIDHRQQPAESELVQDVYNGSRLYVCPSFAEGWHLPPAEAMACGCAVVSTDIGGVRDYAEHGRNALLCPVGDAEALAASIVKLLRSDRERQRLAREAVNSIRAFSWDRSVGAFEDYLSDNTTRR